MLEVEFYSLINSVTKVKRLLNYTSVKFE